MSFLGSASRWPKPVSDLVAVIQSVLTDELLTPEWAARAASSCNRLTGQCVNASGALWYLAGGTEAGWRYRNIPARVWSGGPHYFLLHEPTGIVVDPTAEQYGGQRIPYELAEGRAPSTRGRDASGRALPPKTARVVVDRVLARADGRQAAADVALWSKQHQN